MRTGKIELELAFARRQYAMQCLFLSSHETQKFVAGVQLPGAVSVIRRVVG